VSTFITRLDGEGAGPRVAVKDIIDVAGVPTTGGSRALERIAQPAARDAACLAGARAADARIVGKVNLHELAVLPLGTNPWFGTPVNPLDPALIPGGS
jgi:amidase